MYFMLDIYASARKKSVSSKQTKNKYIIAFKLLYKFGQKIRFKDGLQLPKSMLTWYLQTS